MTEPDDATILLSKAVDGCEVSGNRLIELLYKELRALANRVFAGQAQGNSMQPTALVHEAYLRLMGASRTLPHSRAHFFNLAAKAMRQVVADRARARRAAKRGGKGWERIDLGEIFTGSTMVPIDVVSLDEALSQLAELDERQAKIVQLRFLAGLTVKETAKTLNVSTRTVELDWRMAKAWLRQQLSDEGSTDG